MLTAERLREVLEYLPESGLLVWRVVNSNRIKVGQIAGSLDNNGYVVVRIDRKIYKAGRLAWLYMMGEWPRHTIDHINGEPADNRWDNLREATYGQNNANRPGRKGASGFKGVYANGNKWVAHFGNKYIGTFNSPEDAHEAFCEAGRKRWGDFFHDGG